MHALYHYFMSGVLLDFGLPLFGGYALLSVPAAPAVPLLNLAVLKDTLIMKMRITDYFFGSESLLWADTEAWASNIGFAVARDHGAQQIGVSCGIVAAKVAIELKNAGVAGLDYMTVDTR